MERDDRAGAIRAIQRGIELGLTHIDTAELYGSGEVERMVGEAIRGKRDSLFLVSKVMPHNASFEGTLRACEQSLARLGTDRLDLYLLHWAGSHPLEETLRAFQKLCDDRKIARFGVSNFDEHELAAAEAIAPGRIACNQVLYHLEERAIEHAVVPWCRRHEVAMVGYSPFGCGQWVGDAAVLERIAAGRGKSARQVALAFLTREPGWYAIPKAAHEDHVADNAGALGLSLTAEEIAAIDRAFPRGRRQAGVPTL